MKLFIVFWKIFTRTVAVSTLITLGTLTFNANAALDNKGTDFIMAFLHNYDTTATAELHLTGDVATDVTVTYPINAPIFNQVFAIVPGTVTIVTLPIAAYNGWTPNSVQDNLVRAVAVEEFVAYQINRRTASSDAALALPVDTMNLEYMVSDYNTVFTGEFAVYAAFDNTTVTITPTNALIGHGAGVPFNIVLNQGEGYYARSAAADPSGTLIGTKVESDRPVGLVNGNRCTNVPLGIGACDHIFEVAQPLVSWGLTASAGGLPNRPNGTVYRILASEDNTTVSINGVVQGVINSGQFIETAQLPGNQFFSADKAIFVTQYMTGQNAPGAVSGDPAMANIIPSAQYQNHYTFSTVGGAQFAENFLTIIADNADVGLLTLDGVPVPAINYTPIPGQPLSAAIVPLSDGPHVTSSTNSHGITVEGYNGFDSYIFPGGALFQFINPHGDPYPPVCTLDINNNAATGAVTDNKPSEDINGNDVLDPGEDVNGNGVIDEDTGVFFVEATNIVNIVFNLNPFTPGDEQATYTADLIDPNQPGSATITGTDGAGNICTLDIDLNGNDGLICDTDGDLDIDRIDLRTISLARNQPALPNDPRDANGDGIITPSDVKICIPLCTLARCAIQ